MTDRVPLAAGSYSNTSSPEGQVITWDSEFEPASNVTPYIVIPEDGFYFVYLNFAIFCNPKGAKFIKFVAELHRSSEGYGIPERLMEVHDGLRCKSLKYRNVFVGQLLKLLKKDRLSVLIKEGFDLIHKATFGAYLV